MDVTGFNEGIDRRSRAVIEGRNINRISQTVMQKAMIERRIGILEL